MGLPGRERTAKCRESSPLPYQLISNIRVGEKKKQWRPTYDFWQRQIGQSTSIVRRASPGSRLHRQEEFLAKLNAASKAPNLGLKAILDFNDFFHLSDSQRATLGTTSSHRNLSITSTPKLLEEQIEKGFDVPLLIPQASPCGQDIRKSACKGPTSISDFLKSFEDSTIFSVQNYGVGCSKKEDSEKNDGQGNDGEQNDGEKDDGKEAEYIPPIPKTCHEIKDMFSSTGHDGMQDAWNMLDIGSSTVSQRYTPPCIANRDLLRRGIKVVGQAGRELHPKNLEQFFLISRRGSISNIHADTTGVGTWVHIIAGSKRWYWWKGLSDLGTAELKHVTVFASIENQEVPDGWSYVTLSAG